MDSWQNPEQREDKYGDHGGDHRAYLAQKRQKLDTQRRRSGGGIFKGCVVWVDGLTDPPFEDLAKLVLEGGGLVESTFCPRATHVVAANMTRAQIKKCKARKRGLSKPAVTAAWVVESAARRCRQDVGPYLLWRASASTNDVLATGRARANLLKAGVLAEPVAEEEDASSVLSEEAAVAAPPPQIGGPTVLGRVGAWTEVGPTVAMYLARADPTMRATVLVLLELASEFVEQSRLDDAASLSRLLEQHAGAHPAWRGATLLLADLVGFLVRDKYGGALALHRDRPDWAFLLSPSQ